MLIDLKTVENFTLGHVAAHGAAGSFMYYYIMCICINVYTLPLTLINAAVGVVWFTRLMVASKLHFSAAHAR